MLKANKEYLALLGLIIMVLIIFILAWHFVFSPMEDNQPSRSRMVWQIQGEGVSSICPTRLYTLACTPRSISLPGKL